MTHYFFMDIVFMLFVSFVIYTIIKSSRVLKNKKSSQKELENTACLVFLSTVSGIILIFVQCIFI